MAEEKKTRFTGKRLSRKIVPISVAAIIGVALIFFIMKYGVNSKSPAQLEKERKAKEEQQSSVTNSQKMTTEQAKSELEQREETLKANKEKIKAEKEEAERKAAMLAALNSSRDSEYPATPISTPQEINAYEQKKISTNRFGESKSMAVYENYKGAGLNGIATSLLPNQVGSYDAAARMEAANANKAAQDILDAEKNESLDPNTKFNQSLMSDGKNSEAIKPKAAPSKFMVMEGVTIQSVLVTAIDSQLPNGIVARVTEDVYDSILGQYLLIPAGSIVRGTYNSSVVEGQDRVFISFSRLIYPTGASIELGSMSGSDSMGRGGAKGNVFTEFWRSLGSSFLIAAVGSIADNQNNTVNNYGGTVGLSSATGQILADTARSNLEKFGRYKPRITVDAGEKLTIVVSKDMHLDPAVTFKGPR